MFETKEKVLFIPYFWDRKLYEKVKKWSVRFSKIFLSDHLQYNNYSIITGFMGYPQILYILKNIKNILNKEIFFLGTAGAVNEDFTAPISLNITEVFPDSIFKHFSNESKFSLKTIKQSTIREGTCISVDIPERETKEWVKTVRRKKIDSVEMEIYPIRVFIKKPFTAIVIITDTVNGDLKIDLMNLSLIKKEFVKSFELLSEIYNLS